MTAPFRPNEPVGRHRLRWLWLPWTLLALTPLAVVDLFMYGLGAQLSAEACGDRAEPCASAQRLNIQFGAIFGLTVLCLAASCLLSGRPGLRRVFTGATLAAAGSPILVALAVVMYRAL